MKEYTNNEQSELLNQYLDNELDPTREQELFSMLSEDEALQSEMKEMLAIRESVQKDTEAYTPPQKSTKRIFAALGYSIPAATISGGLIATTGAFIGKAWLPAASAIVASIVTTILFVNYFDDSGSNTAANENMSAKKDIPIVSSIDITDSQDETLASENSSTESVNMAESIDATESNNNVGSNTNGSSESNNTNNLVATDLQNSNNSSASSDTFVRNDNDQAANNDRLSDLANNLMNPNPMNELAQNNIFGINPVQISIYSNYRMSSPNYGFRNDNYDIDDNPMSFRRNEGHMVSIYVDGLQNTNNELYNNKSIGVLLRNFGNFRGGFEASIMNMFIESNNTDLGSYLISAYLVGRYENIRFNIGGIQPFAQFNFGFSNVGPAGQLHLGAEYILTNLLGADLGLQASYGTSYFYLLSDKQGYNQENLNLGLSLYFR